MQPLTASTWRGAVPATLLADDWEQKERADQGLVLMSPQSPHRWLPPLAFQFLIQRPFLSATNIFLHAFQSTLRKFISRVINGIYILSALNGSPLPKARATVSTKHRVSISYKLNTLQLSLFPLLLFHPVLLCDEFCAADSFSP